MSKVGLAPGVLAVILLAGPLPAGAQDAPNAEAFRYPLRQNESLIDVARIFQVPVEELALRNGITDPNRLRAGLLLEIPNAHAERVTMLTNERTALVRGKTDLERELVERQTAIRGLAQKIDELERGTRDLGSQLAATAHWERGAKVVALLLLAMIAWALKLASDRAALSRRMVFLGAENEALTVAKEKLRDAVGQMELRFQQLYSGRATPSTDVVGEGTTRIRRTFEDGARQIDRLVTSLTLEREKEEQILEAEHKMLGWIAHPVREVLARNARG